MHDTLTRQWYPEAMSDHTFSTPLIVANWKSHKTWDEVGEWLSAYQAAKPTTTGTVAVAPAFPFLEYVADEIEEADLDLQLAVQDLSPFPPGAYTGAVSTANLSDLPIQFAILGHSERRRYFHETNQEVANKVDLAIEAGITPIVCVDEPYQLAQRAALSPQAVSKCVVAYEPVEAIGSGLPQPAEEAAKVIERIREDWGDVPIIYGGSVNEENLLSYLKVCQGVLVATHSLDGAEFAKLVKMAL